MKKINLLNCHCKILLDWATDIRVGPEIVTDPAFLVTRLVMKTHITFFSDAHWRNKNHTFNLNILTFMSLQQLKFILLFIYNCSYFIVQYCYRSMEDFITWVDSSKIKQHVMNYNEEVRGRILDWASFCRVYTLLYKSLGSIYI